MIAIAAIHGSSSSGFEGNLGFFPTFAAGYGIHLPVCWRENRIRNSLFLNRMFRSAGSSFSAAFGTSLRWMGMPFSVKSLLFLNTKT